MKNDFKYDIPNGSLFISILLHNSEFWIPISETRNLLYEFRNPAFGIMKYMLCGQVVKANIL